MGAHTYLRNQFEHLLVYLDDGLLPIDNNETEQLMKQVALGRKNWMFIGSVAAGYRVADLMSLVSSAARNDLDVFLYVKDVLDRLLAGEMDYDALRPDGESQRRSPPDNRKHSNMIVLQPRHASRRVNSYGLVNRGHQLRWDPTNEAMNIFGFIERHNPHPCIPSRHTGVVQKSVCCGRTAPIEQGFPPVQQKQKSINIVHLF